MSGSRAGSNRVRSVGQQGGEKGFPTLSMERADGPHGRKRNLPVELERISRESHITTDVLSISMLYDRNAAEIIASRILPHSLRSGGHA